MTNRYRLAVFLCILGLSPEAWTQQLPGPFEADNGLLKLGIDRNSKTWNLSEWDGEAWKVVVGGATMSLAFHDRDSLSLISEQAPLSVKTETYSDELGKGKKVDVVADGPEARWSATFVVYDDKKFLTLSAGVGNKSQSDWKPARFHLLDVKGAGHIGFDSSRVLMHVNGYQSWSNSEVVKLDSSTRNTSYWSTVFYEPDYYSSLLLGFLTNSQAVNSFSVGPLETETAQIRLSSTADLGALVVRPNREVRSDRMIISFDPSPTDNLRRYGEFLQALAPTINKPFTPSGKDAANRPGTSRVPAGWCSWYYYYQHISEDSILLNLDAAARDFREAGLRYIQIDDGYQIAAGDWNMNARFPHGHKWLTDQIHNKGLLAGLWLAPFAVAESSSVYKEHRNWLLRDAGDTLKQFFANDWWGGRIFTLDPTRPEVQLWLENLFYTIINVWGYNYVKIDFLYFPADGGKYSKPVTPAQAYQMGLQSIRRGTGSDRFILGCGAPLGPSIGLVDGMRIGNDVYAAWEGVTPGVNAAANRWFYHRTVWYDDPDCLVVRDPLTLDQARAWAGVVALSGQMNLLSDKLPALSQDRRNLIQMTLPVYGRGATPVDLFSEPREEGLMLRAADGSSSLRLPRQWKFSPGDSSIRKEKSFDDGGWKDIPVPARWENSGYPGLDGFAWYRAKFSLPAGMQRGPVKLYLGRIDDCDETYVNGALVGKSGTFPPDYATQWTAFRIYKIPENVIDWDGENTIAIRVYDGGGPGGWYSIRQLNLPTVWNLKVDEEYEKWNVVGAFNWSTDESDVTIEAAQLGLQATKKYLAYEKWSDRYLGEFKKSITLKLNPTSSQILSIHERPDHPIVLSTSRHVTQGAADIVSEEWNASTKTLSVTSGNLVEGTYSAVLYVPAGLEFDTVISPSRGDTSTISSEAMRVSFPIAKRISLSWKVKFR